GFVIGRIAGLVLLVGAGLVIFSMINDPGLAHQGHPRPAVSVARIVIGALLIGLAVRMWRRRTEPAKPRAMTRRVDGLTPRGWGGCGLEGKGGRPVGPVAGLPVRVRYRRRAIGRADGRRRGRRVRPAGHADDHDPADRLLRRRTGRAYPPGRRQDLATVER